MKIQHNFSSRFIFLSAAGLLLGTVPATRVFAQNNEQCLSATIIVSLPYEEAFDNSKASADGLAGSCQTGGTQGIMHNDLWWMMRATETCRMTVEVTPIRYNGAVVLSTGTDCNALSELGCQQGAGPLVLTHTVLAGKTYWIQVGQDGDQPGGGDTGLKVTCEPVITEVDLFEETTACLTLQGEPLGLTPLRVILRGPTEVHVPFDGPEEGDAIDDDGNGLDEVQTEMVALNLSGDGVSLSLNPARPTLGGIEEQVNNTPGRLDVDPFAPGNADSFFDVFFQVDLGGPVLHNEQPLRLVGFLEEKPPVGTRFVMQLPDGPLELFDADNRPTGIFVTGGKHYTGMIEVDEFPTTEAEIELVYPDGGSELISLAGPSEAHVFFPGAEGDARDSDNNNLDDVFTELVEMNLSGNSALGPMSVRLNPLVPSVGRIEEQVNNTPGRLDVNPFAPGNANSFFDVFFEIEVVTGAGPLLLYPALPKRMQTVITHKPPGPGDTYENPTQIPLNDAAGNFTGFFIGSTRHTPNPARTIETDIFDRSVCQVLIQRGGNTVQAETAAFPPTLGEIRMHRETALEFTDPGGLGDITLSDLCLQVLQEPPPRSFPVGVDEQAEFAVAVELCILLFDPLRGESEHSIQLLGPAKTLILGRNGQDTGTWDTEMLSMDLTGQIPGGPTLMLRQDPTRPSRGGLCVLPGGDGTFVIDSFFDVWTEISIDGGARWLPAVQLADLNLVQPGFHPPDPGAVSGGSYVQRNSQPLSYAGPNGPLLLCRLRVVPQRFPAVECIPEGADERQIFTAQLCGEALVVPPTGGPGMLVPFALQGPVETLIRDRNAKAGSTFDTEILSMDLRGSIPGGPSLILRESPTLPSPGQTTLSTLPGGNFNVDSFFDVWTEVSVDGGDIYLPADRPLRVISTPAPELVALAGPSTVQVHFEGTSEGDAQDNDGDGLDEVPQELTELVVDGYAFGGPVRARLRSDQPSLGEIEELLNNTPGTLDVNPFAPTGAADSFFDVWTELTIAGNQRTTRDALHLVTLLRHKPPLNGERFANLNQAAVEIIDPATGRGTESFVLRKIYQPDPTIEADTFSTTSLSLQLQGGSIGPEPQNLVLSGTTLVHVYFEGLTEGKAIDDDLDGLDEVVTELISLDLTGGGVSLRVRDVARAPFVPSLGAIVEQANNLPGTLEVNPFAPGHADSFFDVFFEITLADDRVLHNVRPIRIAGEIAHKPDIAPLVHCLPDRPVELFDDQENPTGIFVNRAVHHGGALEIDEFAKTTALLNLVGEPLGAEPVSLALYGPATHHVYFEGAEGRADDDDGNGRDEVQSDLMALNLSDGRHTLRLRSGTCSRGQILEFVNNTPGLLDLDPFAPGTADQFFDVFFELDLGDGRILHNAEAVLILAIINHKPDIARYIMRLPSGQPLELLDSDEQPSGIFLTGGEHYTGCIEVDRFTASQVELRLQDPTGQEELVQLGGTSKMHVYFEADEGRARDDDGNGRDEVQTELVSLSLTGNSSLGPVMLHLPPGQPGRGVLEEQVNNTPGLLDLPPFSPTGQADSFFDVFFELEVGGARWVTALPLRPVATVTLKPATAGDWFFHQGAVELLEAITGERTGFVLNTVAFEPNMQPIILLIRDNLDGTVTVCWPLQATGFGLQGSPSLNVTNWVPIPGTIVPVNGMHCITFAPVGTYEAYRLFK